MEKFYEKEKYDERKKRKRKRKVHMVIVKGNQESEEFKLCSSISVFLIVQRPDR